MYNVAEIGEENTNMLQQSIPNPKSIVEPKKRVYYLDILRILAIIAVLAVHSTASPVEKLQFIGKSHWWIGNCINASLRWAIPVFFMISGALILNSVKEESIGKFYKRTFKKLFIPFMVWSVIYFLFKYYYILGTNKEPLEMVGLFFNELLFDNVYNHLWFMYIILTMYLIAPFLKKLIKDLTRNEILIWLGVWIVVSFIYPLTSRIWSQTHGGTPLNISFMDIPFFTGFIGYFILGYYLSKYELKKVSRGIIYVMGFLSGIAAPILTYLLSVNAEVLDETFYGHFAITSVCMGMAVFIYIKSIDWDKLMNIKLKKLVASISRVTFGIYFSHMMIQTILYQDLLREVFQDSPIVIGIYFLNVIAVYLTSYVFVKIVGLSSKLNAILIGN